MSLTIIATSDTFICTGRKLSDIIRVDKQDNLSLIQQQKPQYVLVAGDSDTKMDSMVE